MEKVVESLARALVKTLREPSLGENMPQPGMKRRRSFGGGPEGWNKAEGPEAPEAEADAEPEAEAEPETLEKRTISVAGKTFTLEALVESLSDPAEAAQIGLNTLGNLATLATEIAIIQKEGVKDHELSLIGTIVGFVGWALILACRAEEHDEHEEREEVEKRTISVVGKTFTLEALLEGLKDPLVASQIGLNTAGILATLGTEIAKNNSDGLSITGTALGFVGWAALLAHAAKEPVGFEEANCPEYCQNKCKQTWWQKIIGYFSFGAESEAACLTACLADCN